MGLMNELITSMYIFYDSLCTMNIGRAWAQTTCS